MSEAPSISSSVRQGLRAARANIGYGLVLQAMALFLVLGYYYYAPIRAILDRLSNFRAESGLLFGMVSTSLSGGLLPFVLLRLFSKPEHRQSWAMGALATGFWFYKGLEVEIWYRALTVIFGPGNEVSTVIWKTLADQAFYCPVIAIPLTVFVYSWSQFGFKFGRLLADVRSPGWYARRVLTPLISNLGVWLPACAIIYSLPLSLQLPLQNMVLVFFTLILAHLTSKRLAPH